MIFLLCEFFSCDTDTWIQQKGAKCATSLGLDRDLLALSHSVGLKDQIQMVGGIWEQVQCGRVPRVPRTMTTFCNQMPMLRRKNRRGELPET